MKLRLSGTLVLITILCIQAFAHSGKPKYQVMIDTDGAIDDMRALTMFLSGNDIRVLAITCSQGSLLPDSVYEKVRSLLSVFHHEGIPVGIGEAVRAPSPAWRSFAQDIRWADGSHPMETDPNNSSMEILNESIKYTREKITLIALGSLKTYADWIRRNDRIKEQIERIIWFNNHEIREGYNYTVAPESYEYIRQSGILLEIVADNSDPLSINEDYLEQLHQGHSIYAKQIVEVHSRSTVLDRIKNRHLKLWDDLVPLYLTAPVLFEIETGNKLKFATLDQNLPPDFVFETIGKLLESASVTNNRAFLEFPVDSTLYKPAYSRMLSQTIEKFGLIEWKAICMTNEIHGHTGIYSIIGAKVGIRAMEYFNVGVNNLTVVTFAGNQPPLSCFNDGIQISSGATIGQGLITVSDSISAVPSAIFEFNHRKVQMSLKPEIAERIRNDIAFAIENYGLLTERYWAYIERLAIEYWANFDRNELLLIEPV